MIIEQFCKTCPLYCNSPSNFVFHCRKVYSPGDSVNGEGGIIRNFPIKDLDLRITNWPDCINIEKLKIVQELELL